MEFTVAEIKEATCNFDSKCLVGVGAFGRVYLGKNFRTPGTNVAIKLLSKVRFC